MDAGGSLDMAHDSVAPWGLAMATSVLYRADTAVFCWSGKVTVNRSNTFVYICVHAHEWTLCVYSLCVCVFVGQKLTSDIVSQKLLTLGI